MRVYTVRLLLVALTASLLLAPSAGANDTAMKQRYSALYHAVKKRHGSRAPGRNIRKLGIRFDIKAAGKPGPWRLAKPSRSRSGLRSANSGRCCVPRGACSSVALSLPAIPRQEFCHQYSEHPQEEY
jgi:hypothetical protein